MNETALLMVFYNEMKARGLSYDAVFLSIDQSMIDLLHDVYEQDVTLRELEEAADICIANQWIQRTTADPNYNFLSLTEKGLQKIMKFEYDYLNQQKSG